MTGVVNDGPDPTIFDAPLVQTTVEELEAPVAVSVTDELPHDVPPATVSVSVTGHDGGACCTVILSIDISPVKDEPRTPLNRNLTDAADGRLTARSNHGSDVPVCC